MGKVPIKTPFFQMVYDGVWTNFCPPVLYQNFLSVKVNLNWYILILIIISENPATERYRTNKHLELLLN